MNKVSVPSGKRQQNVRTTGTWFSQFIRKALLGAPRHLQMFALTALASGAAHAALIDRGGGLIYDDVQNITWLQDANYALTSGHDADGQMTYNSAIAWAAGLTYFDPVRGSTYDDWRLPTTGQPDATCSDQFNPGDFLQGRGTGCTGSEMGHLSTNDGVSAGSPGLFTNVQGENDYWSGTVLSVDPTGAAWMFQFSSSGRQDLDGQAAENYAWAVRDGDVVPIPAAVWLFGSALGLLGWTRRKAI